MSPVSLFSKNDYFLRQLQKGTRTPVYPMVAGDVQEAYPNIPGLLPPAFCCDELYRDPNLVAKKGKSYTEDQVVRILP